MELGDILIGLMIFIVLVFIFSLIYVFVTGDINNNDYKIEIINRYVNTTQTIKLSIYNGFNIVDIKHKYIDDDNLDIMFTLRKIPIIN